MSGGTAIFFNAWRDSSIVRPASERSQLAFMSVSIAPGAMAFTVIPRAPSSWARTRVMTSMAPFVAEYAVNIGFAKRLSPELSVTIRPLSLSRGSAPWIRKNTPLTLVSKRESKSASVVSAKGFEMRTPAFATRTSMDFGRPLASSAASTRSKNEAIPFRLLTSPWTSAPFPPSFWISRRTSSPSPLDLT